MAMRKAWAGKRRDPVREEYPLLDAFGDATTRFLGPDEAARATPAERIRSIRASSSSRPTITAPRLTAGR